VAELPLAGRRIVVTRPRAQAEPLAASLERLGAAAVVVPLVEIAPVDDPAGLQASVCGPHRFDWLVVTSANGVAALVAWAGFPWLRRELRVAAVGPATAEALRRVGVEPDFVPERFAAEEIAEGLGPVKGGRILLVQSDAASRELGNRLQALGARVDAVVGYRTVETAPTEAELEELRLGADAVVLASGSAARSLASLALSDPGVRRAVSAAYLVCIGPKTAAVAHELGLEVDLVAREATAEGIIEALVCHFQETS
jgi:uroporphyrinogen-III synthase